MAISWNEQNASQEALNAWLHGFAFLASLPCGMMLIYLASKFRSELVFSCVVYGISLSALYLTSTLSHAIREPVLRHRFRAWDQGLIYCLIAGTLTPIADGYLNGLMRISVLLLVWIAAAAGFYSKVFSKHRINSMTTVSYILLGWVPSMILFGFVSIPCFLMMAIGGILYTVGTIFLQHDHRRWYFHAIWHLMVVVASSCHFAAIIMFTVLQWDRTR